MRPCPAPAGLSCAQLHEVAPTPRRSRPHGAPPAPAKSRPRPHRADPGGREQSLTTMPTTNPPQITPPQPQIGGFIRHPQQRADTSPTLTPSSRAASLLHLQNPKGCGSGGGRAPSSLPAPKTQPGRTHLLFRVFTATEPAHGGTSSNARACLGCWQRKYFVTGAQRSGCSPAPVYSPIFGAGAEGSSTGVTQLGVNTQPSAGPAPAPVNHSCCS